jgi:hypothetical protein
VRHTLLIIRGKARIYILEEGLKTPRFAYLSAVATYGKLTPLGDGSLTVSAAVTPLEGCYLTILLIYKDIMPNSHRVTARTTKAIRDHCRFL